MKNFLSSSQPEVVGLFILGIAASVFAVLRAFAVAAFVVGSRSAVGTVTAVERRGDRTGDPFSPRVDFMTADGRKISFLSNVLVSSFRYAVGQRVQVRYRPDEPSTAEIDSLAALAWLPLLCGVVGLGLVWAGGSSLGIFPAVAYSHLIWVLAAVVTWVAAVWMLRSAAIMSAGAIFTEGTVVAKVGESRESEQWRVSFVTADGQTLTFDAWWSRSALPVIGRKVNVRYMRSVPADAGLEKRADFWLFPAFMTVVAVGVSCMAAAVLWLSRY